MKFKKALKEKFKKGVEEHGSGWGSDIIDYMKELQEEMIDSWWYADEIEDKDVKNEVQGFAHWTWKRLQHMIDKRKEKE